MCMCVYACMWAHARDHMYVLCVDVCVFYVVGAHVFCVFMLGFCSARVVCLVFCVFAACSMSVLECAYGVCSVWCWHSLHSAWCVSVRVCFGCLRVCIHTVQLLLNFVEAVQAIKNTRTISCNFLGRETTFGQGTHTHTYTARKKKKKKTTTKYAHAHETHKQRHTQHACKHARKHARKHEHLPPHHHTTQHANTQHIHTHTHTHARTQASTELWPRGTYWTLDKRGLGELDAMVCVCVHVRVCAIALSVCVCVCGVKGVVLFSFALLPCCCACVRCFCVFLRVFCCFLTF